MHFARWLSYSIGQAEKRKEKDEYKRREERARRHNDAMLKQKVVVVLKGFNYLVRGKREAETKIARNRDFKIKAKFFQLYLLNFRKQRDCPVLRKQSKLRVDRAIADREALGIAGLEESLQNAEAEVFERVLSLHREEKEAVESPRFEDVSPSSESSRRRVYPTSRDINQRIRSEHSKESLLIFRRTLAVEVARAVREVQQRIVDDSSAG